MNDASSFQEVLSSTSRSSSYRYRFLHEQRHQFGTGPWYLVRSLLSSSHNYIALCVGICIRRVTVLKAISGLMAFSSPGHIARDSRDCLS
jgi:hypothetical protein